MVNKLRTLAITGSVSLLMLVAWAAVRYGVAGHVDAFLRSVALAVAIFVLPTAVAQVKLRVYGARRSFRRRRTGTFAGGPTYVSATSLDDPAATLTSIEDTVRAAADYRTVHREAFSEGEGLMVQHTDVNSSFVRITESARLVVSGPKTGTRRLVDLLEATYSMALEPVARNPFHRARSARGGLRVVLGLVMVLFFIVGVSGVANAAYPSGAYNSAEKTVLVSMDLRADLDPGTSPTKNRLAKAAFLVEVLDEKAVEVRWEQNSSHYIADHAGDAQVISTDVRELLRTVRASDPTPEQAARADRIEADLHAAERAVAAALADRAEQEGAVNQSGPLLSSRSRLLTAANTSVDS